MRFYLMALFCLFLVNSCDGGGSSGGSGETVSFNAGCGITPDCSGADVKTSGTKRNYRTYQCKWEDVTYNGIPQALVQVYFRSTPDGCWEFVDVYVEESAKLSSKPNDIDSPKKAN